MDNLLKDLISLRSSYLCFGKQNDQLKEELNLCSTNKKNSTEKNKKKKKNKKYSKNFDDIDMEDSDKFNKCDCFSCAFNTIDKNKSFKCGKCDINTNLRLQLIDPNKDDDLTICGFCNVNDYFKSFSNIFENEDKLELVKTNDNIFAQYSKYSKEFKNKKNKKNEEEKMDDIIQDTEETNNKDKNIFEIKFIEFYLYFKPSSNSR